MFTSIKDYWALRNLNLLVFISILLGVSALWVWGFNTHSFTRRDAYDYGQLSVQAGRGNGLSTLQLFPRHLPYFQEKGILDSENWPNLYRSPLLVLFNVIFQKFFESTVVSLIVQSGFWYVVSIPLIFFLATRLANTRVAAAASLVYAADPVIILYSYSGMTETLGFFLLLALFFLASKDDLEPWYWSLIGILTSLAYLARAQFIILFPLVLLFSWIKSPRSSRTAVLLFTLIGLLIPLVPWTYRNFQVTGDPLFSFTNSRNLVLDAVPGHSDLEMQLQAPVNLPAILRQFGQEIMVKFFRNIVRNFLSFSYWTNSFRGPFLFLLVFFILAIFDRGKTSREARPNFRWSVLILILATFLMISLTVYSVRSYLMFRPLIYLVALREIDSLFLRMTRKETIVPLGMSLFVAAAIVILSASVNNHRNVTSPESIFDERTYRILNREIDEDTVIASDISEKISLYLDVRTIRLPSNPIELIEINDRYLPLNFVLISKELLSGSSADESETGYHEIYQDYIEFVNSPAFLQAFEFERPLPNGSVLYKRINPGD